MKSSTNMVVWSVHMWLSQPRGADMTGNSRKVQTAKSSKEGAYDDVDQRRCKQQLWKWLRRKYVDEAGVRKRSCVSAFGCRSRDNTTHRFRHATRRDKRACFESTTVNSRARLSVSIHHLVDVNFTASCFEIRCTTAKP